MAAPTVHVEELMPAYVAGSLQAESASNVAAHLARCPACRASLDEWRAVAAATQAAAGAPAPARGLLDRVLGTIEEMERPRRWRERLVPAWMGQPAFARGLAAGAVIMAFALLLIGTPVGSYAARLLDVFQPKQFAVVPVTTADLQALSQLGYYGDVTTEPPGEITSAAGAAAAGAASGMTVLVPASLPAAVTAAPSYVIVPNASATFTFNAEKAARTAAGKGKNLPPLPANIDGSTIRIATGKAVVAVYGGDPRMITGHGKPSGDAATAGGQASDPVPQLVVGQAFAPVATSSGASPAELEQYVLSLPGISTELSNAIRAIGDPTVTWPIPVPLGELTTHSAQVQGVNATVFSDKSGFVAGVLWMKNGFIHGVAGPLKEGDVLSIANSLR